MINVPQIAQETAFELTVRQTATQSSASATTQFRLIVQNPCTSKPVPATAAFEYLLQKSQGVVSLADLAAIRKNHTQNSNSEQCQITKWEIIDPATMATIGAASELKKVLTEASGPPAALMVNTSDIQTFKAVSFKIQTYLG